MKKLKTPEVLDRIVDRVLAFRPKATNPKQKKRKRKAKKHYSESETEQRQDNARLLKQLQWEANGGA